MSALFYCPDIAQIPILPEEESKHCLQVLRYDIGDTITLIDGKGYFWRAEITGKQGKKCLLKIIKKQLDEKSRRNYYLHLAIAPTKNIDRIEWLLEKCTEIGIDEISFLQCKRSERKEIRLERLEKIAIQAAKQSKKAFLPKINEMQKFLAFLENLREQHTGKWIAHLSDSQKVDISDIHQYKGSHIVLIGPEGDFEKEEIEAAQKAGFEAINLGNSVLRTETAALLVCAAWTVLSK